jgi:hypothetical protein
MTLEEHFHSSDDEGLAGPSSTEDLTAHSSTSPPLSPSFAPYSREPSSPSPSPPQKNKPPKEKKKVVEKKKKVWSEDDEDDEDVEEWHPRTSKFKKTFFFPGQHSLYLNPPKQYPICKVEGCDVLIPARPESFPRQLQEFKHVVNYHWKELYDNGDRFLVTANEVITWLKTVRIAKKIKRDDFPFFWEEEDSPSSSSSSLPLKRKRDSLGTVSIFYRWSTEGGTGFGILATDKIAEVLRVMGYTVLIDRTFILKGEEKEECTKRMIDSSNIIMILFYPECINRRTEKMFEGVQYDSFDIDLKYAFKSTKRLITVILDMSVEDLEMEVTHIAELAEVEPGLSKFTTDKILHVLNTKKVIVLKSTDFHQLKLKF